MTAPEAGANAVVPLVPLAGNPAVGLFFWKAERAANVLPSATRRMGMQALTQTYFGA